MAEVSLVARLRDCSRLDGHKETAHRLADGFVDDTSRFRMYRHREEENQRLDSLMTRRELKSSRASEDFIRFSKYEPGLKVGNQVFGKTRYSSHWGFRAAYAPDSRKWAISDREEWPVVVDVSRLTSHEQTPTQSFAVPWQLWDLKVGLEIWDLVGYLEVRLGGALWKRSDPGLPEGLAEAYAQDLLQKTLEMTDSFRPAFAHVGASVEVKNAWRIFHERLQVPHVWWANVFGPPYVEKYGRDFLLDAPGYRVEELEDGSVLYQVTERFFLTDEDRERGPDPEEVEGYFRQHPALKKIIYRPVLLRS